MSSYDETSDCLYLTVQALNNSQTDGSPMVCTINQQSNAIVQNLSDYNVYLQSITLTSAEMPYFNAQRLVSWDNNNYLTNKMNLSISFLDSTAGNRPFSLAGNTNLLLKGIGNNTGNTWQGVTCFLQFESENSQLTTPQLNGLGVSSAYYPRSYWNVHSINQFMGFINNAIDTIIGKWTGGGGAPIAAGEMYFMYGPDTQFYKLIMPDAFKTSTINLFANTFLERYLDAFRWSFLQNSDVTNPAYTGLDYQFIKTNYPINKDATSADWTYTAEYSSVANLLDVHSILVSAVAGSLQNVKQQIVPLLPQSVNGSLQLPTIAALKNLDIQYDSLQLNSINNTYIQYFAQGLFFPINTMSSGPLTQIYLQLFVQTVDNDIFPLKIPASSGYANVKFCLKKRRKDLK